MMGELGQEFVSKVWNRSRNLCGGQARTPKSRTGQRSSKGQGHSELCPSLRRSTCWDADTKGVGSAGLRWKRHWTKGMRSCFKEAHLHRSKAISLKRNVKGW